MKKYLFIMMCILLALCLTGCSSDDVSEEFPTPETGIDSVKVVFNLYNERGDTTSVFKEGENILFKLSLQNMSECPIIYYTDFTEVGDFALDGNLFRVYSVGGDNIGVPWDYMFIEKIGLDKWSIPSSSLIDIECPLYSVSDSWVPWWHLKKEKPSPTLQKGRYYTKFNVKYKPRNSNEDWSRLIEKEIFKSFTIE